MKKRRESDLISIIYNELDAVVNETVMHYYKLRYFVLIVHAISKPKRVGKTFSNT